MKICLFSSFWKAIIAQYIKSKSNQVKDKNIRIASAGCQNKFETRQKEVLTFYTVGFGWSFRDFVRSPKKKKKGYGELSQPSLLSILEI